MRVTVSDGGTMERSAAEELERHVDDGMYAVPELHEWSEGCDCAHDPDQGCCNKESVEEREDGPDVQVPWCASCFAHHHWLDGDGRESGEAPSSERSQKEEVKAEKNNENEDGDDDADASGDDDGESGEGADHADSGEGADDGADAGGGASTGGGCSQKDFDDCMARVDTARGVDCTFNRTICDCTCFLTKPAPDQGTVDQAESQQGASGESHVAYEVDVEVTVDCDKVWRADLEEKRHGQVHVGAFGEQEVREQVHYVFVENWGSEPDVSLGFVTYYTTKSGGCEWVTEAKKCPSGHDVYRKTRRCKNTNGSIDPPVSKCFVYAVGPHGRCSMQPTASPDACSCKDAKEAAK